MSNRYKGGFITATPPTTTGGYLGTASGNWTTTQQMQAQAAGLWPLQPPPSDPYYEYVTMLLTGNGTNGAQNNTFLDSSSNAFSITRDGDTTQGSFSPYGSLWSNYFPNAYLSAPGTSSAWSWGSSDFTIECWFNCNPANFSQPANYVGLMSKGDNSYAGGWDVSIYASNTKYITMRVWDGSSYQTAFQTTWNWTNDNWNHIAFVRSSGVISVYGNGALLGTNSFSGAVGHTYNQNFEIGRFAGYNTYTKGYISNVRLNNTTAVYTGAFTPSTTPLTAVSGTMLLTCQSNRFVDNSANAFALTPNSSPSVQRFSPFNPTTSYSTSTIGGSGYFNINGSLSVPDSSVFDLGSNDFTLEGWVYRTGNTYQGRLVGQYSGGSDQRAWGVFLETDGSITLITDDNGLLPTTLFATAAGAVRLNAWTHIRVSRVGTTGYIGVNGSILASGSVVSNIFAASTDVTVGNALEGYLTDVRIINGTALSTSSYTVPTAPLTAVTNTQLLLNMTNAGIPDSAMMNDGLTVNNAQVSTTQVKYGTASMKFVATSSTVGDFLSFPASPNYDLSGGAFTIEAWIYPTSVTGYQAIVSRTPTIWKLGLFDNLLQWYNGSSTLESSGTISINTWTHVAVTGDGTTVRLFINGTLTASSTGINPQSGLGVLNVGAPANGTYGGRYTDEFYSGYIDDLRITKGYARYTANFTPPTEAFPTY